MPLNLNTIKEQVQTILETANTTTASTDLSSGLETRVQKVLKVNPARIPIQSTWYPFVTIYIDAKDISEQTMNVNQVNGRRKAEVTVRVAGAVWNSTIVTEDADESDDDAESLMENIEQILRADPTLGGNVTWSYPEGVSYHNMQLEEETSIRAGMMTLKVTGFY